MLETHAASVYQVFVEEHSLEQQHTCTSGVCSALEM